MRRLFLGFAFLLLLPLGAIFSACQEEDNRRSQPSTEEPRTDAKLAIAWRWVEGGTFTMGSPAEDSTADDSEKPMHPVQLSSFWMSQTEVTNRQYRLFLAAMEAKGGAEWEAVKKSGPNFPGLDEKFKGDEQPVVRVSYGDALAFCAWVGHGTTLPTEAQWEYACRAGGSTRYSFGDVLERDQANFNESVWREGGKDISGRTRAVGSYPANAFGLYDMHGNVEEWCADWHSKVYYRDCAREGLVENPTGPERGIDRVARGGSWSEGAWVCHSRNRVWDEPSAQFLKRGFRVVAPLVY
ncbi:MAG: hypothetical protein CSA07_01290 [Bacteroidia bacterium]|nr:MAG: hypothetical protein CSA07_01290 [Bacteroidia bacterium]